MPVQKGSNYYRWGDNGTKYYYVIGNKFSRDLAKAKAKLQGRAIHASR